jgi:hypothetical protein
MLDFLGRSHDQSVADLLARRNYARAIEVIREAMAKRRNDPRLRMQLADVLILSGRRENGVAMLSEVADDLALSGRAAEAIAALKRIQQAEPGRPDVEEKLAYMIAQQRRPSPDPWQRARRRIERAGQKAANVIAPPPRRAFPGDLEDIGDEARVVTDVAALSEAKAAAPAQDAELDFGSSKATLAPEGDLDLAERDEEAGAPNDALRDELLALIEDVFVPGGAGAAGLAVGEAAATPVAVLQTPLFRDFTPDELVEVIRGLNLRKFEAGEILVTEGEPGASLFVLTTGLATAYVRNASGSNSKVRDLGVGAFFGEVSLLKGVPRTATITAATRTELLEIDRDTLNAISQRQPRVWTVLKEFYDQRANSTLEVAARAMGETEPADP